MVYLLNMMIFHGYVKKPDGIPISMFTTGRVTLVKSSIFRQPRVEVALSRDLGIPLIPHFRNPMEQALQLWLDTLYNSSMYN